MKKLLLPLLFCLLVPAFTASAAPLKVFIAKVSAPGAAGREELQVTLQTLLSSRLDGEAVTSVSAASEADALLTVSYIAFGKVFSLEAVAKSPGGAAYAKAFVQGESQDELIPAVNKLAEKLKADLAKIPVQTPPTAQAASQAPVAAAVVAAPAGIVKIADKVKESGESWRSQPLSGVMNLLASGPAGKDGTRDIFIADNRRLFHYRSGEELQLLAEKELKVYEKIVAMDTLESADGLDLYLTVMANEQLSSQIWQVKGGVLQQLASGLPYYFRVLALPGVAKQLYVQKSSDKKAFNGEVYRAERKGGEIQPGEAVKLPADANLYNFNQFVTKNGKIYTVLLFPDNRIGVYDQQLREIWRSTEKYGGSELFMEKSDVSLPSSADQGPPKLYLNQRIQVSAAGDILVGKNDAMPLLGKNWNHSNGAVFWLAWTGESLEPRWRTRQVEYYMPDYFLDEARKELLQLQVISRPFLLSKGATVLTIRKVE